MELKFRGYARTLTVFHVLIPSRQQSRMIPTQNIARKLLVWTLYPFHLDNSKLRLFQHTYNHCRQQEQKPLCHLAKRFCCAVTACHLAGNMAPPTFLRVVFTSTQCVDHDGPRIPSDLVGGHNIGSWPVADRAQKYNRRLADSNLQGLAVAIMLRHACTRTSLRLAGLWILWSIHLLT